MLPGPNFRRELRAVTGRHDWFVVRTALGFSLRAVAVAAGIIPFGWSGLAKDF
jgi:hypothetical protein